MVEPDRIEITWQVPGFREVGTWTIGPDRQVTHTFEQSGPLATVLRPAYRNVATIRLARLANRVRQLAHTVLSARFRPPAGRRACGRSGGAWR